ncbi:ATP-dependent helicase/nuclease subunit A [Halogranum rubrum]|uniref:DNA 3'-5' helicase n=1 Tax=Halogranum rubrum TaxID=553466 RepID=A0A1I4AQT3_9EURY|nr:UvrD-helicase domain-containing protein [Halogranum rubrum]SFK58079.1 ATP-dependent helicase/nuclease subunit A [Halogranum rubrum]
MTEDQARAENGDRDGDRTSGDGSSSEASTPFVRLDGAQRAIRDAFFAHESGLFALESDPGTGKSTTSEHVAAEFLARAHAEGVDAPEETLAFVSFTRDDAAAIGPGIADALEAIARDPTRDVTLSVETARELGRRVQRATNVGTVDSVVGSVFATLATEVGFEEPPVVSDGAGLRSIRATCLHRLRTEDQYADSLDRLDEAYPGGEHRDDVGDLLRNAQLACRERRLSVTAFRTRLEAVVDETYLGGAPDSFADVRDAVEQFVNADVAETFAEGLSAERTSAEAVVSADRTLYEAWTTAVDDLCTVLERYVELYDETTRREGVVSHLDVSHWVAEFFTRDEYAGVFRERLRARHTDRLSAVVVDEAQDVSAVQHAALSGLVDDEMRVLLVGDYKQCIFLWRNALPGLFRDAIESGRYFGIGWDVHVVEHEKRTRRCRPGVAAAVDTVFAGVFTDPARGGDDATGRSYTPLEPTREATADPNVHVAAVTTPAEPGRPTYVTPDSGVGEATALARCLADGLADGSFADPDDSEDDPSVTVLFSRRRNVDAFASAFEREGLVVGDATDLLFEYPLVELVTAVCTWLADPTDDALRTLASDPVFEEMSLTGLFELCSWSVPAVADVDADGRPVVEFVHALDRLLERRPRFVTQSPVTVVETVVDELGLWRDPLDSTDDSTRRVTALDALLSHVEQSSRPDADDSSTSSLVELAAELSQRREDPRSGGALPVVDEGDCDVVCRTIHSMKGAEADVVALGDIGGHIATYGPHTDTLATLGTHLALAPPTRDGADVPAVPGFEHGLFAVDRDPWDYDAGLRWATQRWADDERLAGSPPLRRLSHANRAERWRLLYVALTRARNHLVLPLPTHREDPDPRDRWVDTLREALQFDETRTDSYRCPTPTGESFAVRVHHRGGRPVESDETTAVPTPFVATRGVAGAGVESTRTTAASAPSSERRDRRTWTPRFVNPSTLYPLLTDPDEHLLDYLQRRPLHTEHDGVDDGLPLTFETMGPEDVGDVGHAVLATAIRERVTTETLEQCSGPLARTLRYALADRAGRISADERSRLQRFVADTICPQFAASPLWERLQDAQAVYVEEPVDTLVRVDGLDRELQGVADVLSVDATGTWHVDEVKLVLQSSSSETQKRYRLQAQVYAWAVSKQVASETVVPTITQLGVETRTETVEWDEKAVLDRFGELP